MKWLVFGAAAACLGLAAGCQTDHPGPAEASGAVAATAEPSVQRAQKPDSDHVQQATFGLLSSAPEPLGDKEGQVVAAIRATVNGRPILEQEVSNAAAAPLQEAQSLPEPERTRRMHEVEDKVLQGLIDRELLIGDAETRFGKGNGPKFLDHIKEAADKAFEDQVVRNIKQRYNIKTDDDFKALLRSQGVSVDALRRQWRRQFLYQQYLQFLVQPRLDRIGHEEIVEYYRNHPEEFQTTDSLQWQDIFVAANKFPSREEARRFAEQVRSQAQGGADFANLVKMYDNGDSSYRGGEGFGRHRGEIRPRAVEPVLFQMHDGDVGPVVEVESGFHIIRLIKREYAGQMPIDNEKTQEAIREKLKNEVFAREAKRAVAELRRKATIEIAQKP